MELDLDSLLPNDRRAVAELARETGRSLGDIVAELVHEGLVAKGRNGAASVDPRTDPAYDESRTELGRKLRALSRKYLESGEPLLSADEICAEVAERRGEVG